MLFGSIIPAQTIKEFCDNPIVGHCVLGAIALAALLYLIRVITIAD